MAGNSKLEELRQAVLGNKRGREAEVLSSGEVVLDSGDDQGSGDQPGGERHSKVSKMSPHTFGAKQ